MIKDTKQIIVLINMLTNKINMLTNMITNKAFGREIRTTETNLNDMPSHFKIYKLQPSSVELNYNRPSKATKFTSMSRTIVNSFLKTYDMASWLKYQIVQSIG